MAAIAADRDLLFGLLAWQNGLIDQGWLVAAFPDWTPDKTRDPADVSVVACARNSVELAVYRRTHPYHRPKRNRRNRPRCLRTEARKTAPRPSGLSRRRTTE
jgi:hypothetical protein